MAGASVRMLPNGWMLCWMLPMLPMLTAACAKQSASIPPRGVSVYDIVVATGSGQHRLTAQYAIESRQSEPGIVIFTTLRSEALWEEPGQTFRYESDVPRGSDPWPARLQHAVSSVPASVELDELGSPRALVDETRWQQGVRAALYALAIPVQALHSGEQMVDAEGMVLDLKRNFPGTPPRGPWVRQERMGDMVVSRVEQCKTDPQPGTQSWTCTGQVRGPTEGPVRLHEVTSWTRVDVDRRGFKRLESSWSGTIVELNPTRTSLQDRPIAGRRLVLRR